MEIALHASPGTTLADLEQITTCSEKELPSLGWSLAPILLPIVLISAASFTKALHMEQHSPILNLWVDFFGNRNVALILSTVIAMILLARHKGYSVAEICTRIGAPLETAGVIILITSAGGAYGLMLKNAGVGESIQALVAGREVNLVLLAWLVSSLIRIAQGSATVAMLSTSAIMLPIISASALPFHPIYLFMAIGFGSANLSWMNDSGFWVISKLTGMTEKETLRTWTVISTTISISGVITTLLCSKIFPMAMR
jgi:GntP family gluconate:H+ symporter